MGNVLEFRKKGGPKPPRLVVNTSTGTINKDLDTYFDQRIERFKAHLARIEKLLAEVKLRGQVPETSNGR
jgi:hypothetical protein